LIGFCSESNEDLFAFFRECIIYAQKSLENNEDFLREYSFLLKIQQNNQFWYQNYHLVIFFTKFSDSFA